MSTRERLTAAAPEFMRRWRARATGPEAARLEAVYRRRVGLLKVVVPAAAALLLVAVIAWPSFTETNPGFRLGFAEANYEISGRDEILNPRFVGTDAQHRPFTVTAEVAMRPLDGGERIYLMMPEADIALDDGEWILVKAEQGIYDPETEQLDLEGDVALFTASGFEFHTEAARVDLKDGTARGDRPVAGQGPWGLLNAAGFTYRQAGHVFHFSGRPTLVLYPGAAEG